MAKTMPMSRFIQNYNQHLVEAERTDDTLVLEQRGGRPSWVLESARRAEATSEATRLLSNALAALVHDEMLLSSYVTRLLDELPWVGFLPEVDRASFVTEAAEALRACASVGRFTALVVLIEDWRNTADVWSDPELAANLLEGVPDPLDQPV
ncbi:hypothetical protein BJY21_003590 [Kineosphaera limosa]|uniref:Prevent-host-death family protein n=1 Tax=Kineosphaera limosa NBRC 100340 TaxID=1184609 RepID=K6WQF7_9MICO|nr:hypothetical protein [Kineosphaera limosa]NYE02406.1 hypothetical protein [Kineosphaera limosa]GAB96066.1 hypothetical protein KILIM_031_00380 [Kineosphaera limosa NBRC 100340]